MGSIAGHRIGYNGVNLDLKKQLEETDTLFYIQEPPPPGNLISSRKLIVSNNGDIYESLRL